LISEALRGEGAVLRGLDGVAFMKRHHAMADLAPRDVVARAIEARGTALLDLRPVDRSRFPTLMQRLAEAGFDPSEPVPVAPAAHYTMGGIVADVNGATEVSGLYAAGECACTGVHGANRLASNSMLECLVFGRRAALAALEEPRPASTTRDLAVGDEPPVTPELRESLWRDGGLVRERADLERLAASPHLLTSLLARSALAREESRGGHFRCDFPHEDPRLIGLHTVLRPGHEPSLEAWS